MKTWKSDGPETKHLEKLLRDGKVTANSKPSDVQRKYPIFNGFSAAVFRKHWALAKEKCCGTGNHFEINRKVSSNNDSYFSTILSFR